jgi:hypothetical protein
MNSYSENVKGSGLLGHSSGCEICLNEIRSERVHSIQLVQGEIQGEVHIVAYLLKERAVEAEKQPLLGNGLYTRSRGTLHLRCDVT